MESWFYYAILSWMFSWLYAFWFKFSAEKNHSSFLMTGYSMIVYSFLSLFSLILVNNYVLDLYIVLFISIITWTIYFLSNILRIESLKNISSIIYFPIYKTLGPIIVLLIAIIFFEETPNSKELFWIIIWISVPLILITKKEKEKNKNLKKWVIFLIVSTILAALASSSWKLIVDSNYNAFFYMFASWWFWWLLSMTFYLKKHHKRADLSISKIKRTWIINWILLFFSIYFFILACKWNLAIAYTINSLSILIPIVLSVIFYKEDLTKTKIIAVILTLVSLFFMK